MTASEIILNSKACKELSRRLYPEDPDELFNTCWLILREMEIKDPTWQPRDAKHYFNKSMRTQVIKWQKERRHYQIDTLEISQQPDKPYSKRQEQYFYAWLEQSTDDKNLLFLKDILILAVHCADLRDAANTCEMSPPSFYKYKKLAEKRVYDDFNTSNPYDISSTDLV